MLPTILVREHDAMANVEKISVALTPEMAATMREVVSAGEYASASEVMREALREWKQRRLERGQAIEAMGRQWDEGIASGAAADGEQAFARLRARLDGRLSETGQP
jgi:antitoxin ParD1/3/4